MRIFVRTAFLLLVISGYRLSGQNVYLNNYQSSQQQGNSLVVTAGNGSIIIQPYTDKMIKVSLVATGTVDPDTSYSVIDTSTYSDPIFQDNGSYLTFSTDSVTVIVQKDPVRLTFIYNGDTTLQDESGLFTSSGQSGVSFTMQPDEQIYGSGSRAIPVNRRGQLLDLYNTAVGEYDYNTATLNINIPFITSSALYGLYFDNYSEGTLDIGNSDPNVLTYSSASGAFSYYFIAGNSFADLLNSYTTLTGRQPLPPRWAFGYIQSKYGYQSETAAQDIVAEMRQNGFPMDAVVLDLYWYGGQNVMGNLDWGMDSFPTPQAMMSGFDSMGVKTILIAEPYFTQQSSNYSAANNEGLFATNSHDHTYVLNDFWAGSAALLDIFQPAAQQWMWNFYKARTDEGVGGWWSDLGEPEDHPSDMEHVLGPAPTVHNVYSLFWQQMLYNNYRSVYPNTRIFNLSRSGYAGMQRYGATPWSGDVDRSFSGLQAQIPIMLGMGMSGESYIHSDIGGFCCSGENDELYTRWFEYGTFCPIMRAHGTDAPTEPVNYPPNVQAMLHPYATLRYQLLPYNYTLAWENSQTGLPQAKQLNFYNPSDTDLGSVDDEYYWGDAFLVAPVIQQGYTSRNVTFPPGKWINYWDNSVQPGNSTANISAPLNIIPLFVQSGSFIPMAPPLEMTTTAYHADSLYVLYYPDTLYPNSSFTMYDDDGVTPDANILGNYALINFAGSVSDSETDITLSQQGSGYVGMQTERQMIFQLQRSTAIPFEVLVNGIALPVEASLNNFNSIDSSWYLDDSAQVLNVHFSWNETNTVVRILYYMPSGIASVDQQNIMLFPDPVDQTLTVQTLNCSTLPNTELSIYDMSGRMAIHSQLDQGSSSQQNIDVSSLSQGSYLLEMKSSAGVYHAKFVKL